MRIITRPLKAPVDPILDLASLQDHLPLWASDKEDGIRALICPKRGPLTGQIKPIPNRWVRRMLDLKRAHHLDGELIAIDCEGNDCDFNDTQSAIMTREEQPVFNFRVFDCYENIYDPYWMRYELARDKVRRLRNAGFDHFKLLPQTKCETLIGLEDTEKRALERNKEGIMLRDPNGWYKEGRSTLNEAYLLKVKRFTDDEALVVGFEEEMENCNPAKLNERGLQTRSKHKKGLKGKGCVGVLICRWKGKIIYIGSGMTAAQKYRWWAHPEEIVDQHITFKYQLYGMKKGGLPRAPIFKSIRDPRG